VWSNSPVGIAPEIPEHPEKVAAKFVTSVVESKSPEGIDVINAQEPNVALKLVADFVLLNSPVGILVNFEQLEKVELKEVTFGVWSNSPVGIAPLIFEQLINAPAKDVADTALSNKPEGIVVMPVQVEKIFVKSVVNVAEFNNPDGIAVIAVDLKALFKLVHPLKKTGLLVADIDVRPELAQVNVVQSILPHLIISFKAD
jgi:hypothetical protein